MFAVVPTRARAASKPRDHFRFGQRPESSLGAALWARKLSAVGVVSPHHLERSLFQMMRAHGDKPVFFFFLKYSFFEPGSLMSARFTPEPPGLAGGGSGVRCRRRGTARRRARSRRAPPRGSWCAAASLGAGPRASARRVSRPRSSTIWSTAGSGGSSTRSS